MTLRGGGAEFSVEGRVGGLFIEGKQHWRMNREYLAVYNNTIIDEGSYPTTTTLSLMLFLSLDQFYVILES